MRDDPWDEPGPADPLGLMLYRENTKLEWSMLPGFDHKRKAELRAMYRRLPPAERRMLRAIRAQRGIDSIDVFHAVMKHEWGDMSAREKAIWGRVSTFTTQLQAKLKGAARFD